MRYGFLKINHDFPIRFVLWWATLPSTTENVLETMIFKVSKYAMSLNF